MTSITATPDSSTGSVDLSITKTATVNKVVRTNVNGSEEVRYSTGQIPSVGAGTLILTDYEASHGLNSYNVYVGTEVRTNLCVNPRATSLTGYSGIAGTGGTVAYSTPATGGTDNGAYFRSTWTVAGSGGSAGALFSQTVSGVAGDVRSGSIWVRSSAAKDVTLLFRFRNSTTPVGFGQPPYVTLAPNVWTQLIMEGVEATGSYTNIQVYALISNNSANAIGDTLDLDTTMIVNRPVIGDYFDGSTTDVTDITYAWTGTADASTSTETALNGMVTGSVTLDLDKPWLSVPVMPQYSEQVETITQFGAGRESATTVHRPLGRSDSLVVMGKLGDRTGSMEVFCNTYAEARKLERIFERGEVVQLRQRVEGMDLYFTATSIPVSPYSVQGEEITKWAMVLNYVEVRRPIGNLAGALGWTFDELASSATSFDVITQAYLTFDALTLGDANV